MPFLTKIDEQELLLFLFFKQAKRCLHTLGCIGNLRSHVVQAVEPIFVFVTLGDTFKHTFQLVVQLFAFYGSVRKYKT